MADTHRTMTIAYVALNDAGMTVDEIADRIHSMKEVGIPGNAIMHIDPLGARGHQTIGTLTASDQPGRIQ